MTGGSYSSNLKSTEILHIENSEWKDGPDLPSGVYGAQLIAANPYQRKNAGYLIGGEEDGIGYSGKIYSLSKNMDRWSLVGDLKQSRRYFAAITLPNGLLPGCGSTGMYKKDTVF